jgi:hypothetical protein
MKLIEGLFLLLIFFVVIVVVVCTGVIIHVVKKMGVLLLGVCVLVLSILWNLPAPFDPTLPHNLHVDNLLNWIVIRVYLQAIDSFIYTVDILELISNVLKGQ